MFILKEECGGKLNGVVPFSYKSALQCYMFAKEINKLQPQPHMGGTTADLTATKYFFLGWDPFIRKRKALKFCNFRAGMSH